MIWNCNQSGISTDWDGPGQDGMPAYCKWDGVVVRGGTDMNGNSLLGVQEDVYVWQVKLTNIFEKRYTYIGNVNVVK